MIRKTADNNSLQKVNRQAFCVVVYLSYLKDPAKYTIDIAVKVLNSYQGMYILPDHP